jgi:acyl-CoA thioester hydrolase
VNCNIDFVGECLAWDILEVSCGFTKMGNSSCLIEFEMLNTTTQEIATRGSFTYVFVDKATRKSRPIPQRVRDAIIAAQPELED